MNNSPSVTVEEIEAEECAETVQLEEVSSQPVEEKRIVQRSKKDKELVKKNKRTMKTFDAIRNLVNDLWEVYGRKGVNPLSLYHRLCEKIAMSDYASMEKAIAGFRQFFDKCGPCIVENKLSLIPRQTIVCYGDNANVSLDIQKYIYQADEETRSSIREHLLSIMGLMTPSQTVLNELERQLANTSLQNSKEGKFIANIMNKTKTAMAGIDPGSDPMTAVMGLMQSGILSDLMKGITEGTSGGGLDAGKLLTAMTGMVGSLMKNAPPPNDDPVD